MVNFGYDEVGNEAVGDTRDHATGGIVKGSLTFNDLSLSARAMMMVGIGLEADVGGASLREERDEKSCSGSFKSPLCSLAADFESTSMALVCSMVP